MAPALALFLSSRHIANTWERVRTKPEKRTLRVTGSATQRIVSDLIEWQADVVTVDQDRTAAYKALKNNVDQTLEFLRSEGLKDAEIRVSSVHSNELIDTETVGAGENRITRRVSKGWRTRQSISISSKRVELAEKVNRRVTALLEKGIPISSNPPQYHYTKLGEVKVDMLARASADARNRAAKIVEAAGAKKKLGKLWNADMGVININPANSTSTSWEGNNDKSSLEKDIITIVHLTFELP